MFSNFDIATLLLGIVLSIAIIVPTFVPTIHDEIKHLMHAWHSVILVHIMNVAVTTPVLLHTILDSFSLSLETSQRPLGNIYIPFVACCFSVIFLALCDSGLSVTSYCALQRSVNILSVLGVASILIKKNSSLKFHWILLGVVFSFLCGQLIQTFGFLSQNVIFSVVPKILYSFTIILTVALVVHWFRHSWRIVNSKELYFAFYLMGMSLYVCSNAVVYILFNVLTVNDESMFIFVALVAFQAFVLLPVSLIPEYQARSYTLAVAQVMLDIKYKFVRFVAHKLHDPMAIICMGLEGLFVEVIEPPQGARETVELVQDVLGLAQTANEILSELIHFQIAEVTTSLPVELKVVNIAGVFADCFMHIISSAEINDVNFQIEDAANILGVLESEVTPVAVGELELNSLMDKKKIGQVLQNIISNAVKLTNAGGRVVLRTSLSHLRNGSRDAANFKVGKLRVEVEHPTANEAELLVVPARGDSSILSMLPFFSTILNTGLNGGTSHALWLNQEVMKAHGGTMGTNRGGTRLSPNCTTWFELPVYELANADVDVTSSNGYTGLPGRVRAQHTSWYIRVYLIFVASCIVLFFLPVCVFGQNSLLSEAPISKIFKGSDASLAMMFAPIGVLAPMLPLLLTVNDSLHQGCIVMMETRVAALVFILRPILFALTRKTDKGVIIYIACIYLSYIVVAASLASSVQRLSPDSVHWSLLVLLPSTLSMWAVFCIWSYCAEPTRLLLVLSSTLFYIFIAVLVVTSMAWCEYLLKKYGLLNDASRKMSKSDFCCSVYVLTPVVMIALGLTQNGLLHEHSWQKYTARAAVGHTVLQCLVMIPMVLLPLRIVRFHEMETAQRKLQLKELFGRYLGMEIRSPLNYVRTGLDLLRLQAPDDPSSPWNSVSGIDDLIEASAKAISILNDLLYCDDVESDVMQLNLTVVRVSGIFEHQLEAVKRTVADKNLNLFIERDEMSSRQPQDEEMRLITRHGVIVVESVMVEKVLDKIISHAMEGAISGATLKLRIVSHLDNVPEGEFVPEIERSCLEIRGSMRIELTSTGTTMGRWTLPSLISQEKYTLEGGEANLAGWVCRMFVEMLGGSMGYSVDAAASTSTLTVQFPLYMCDTSEKRLLASHVQKQLAASKEVEISGPNSRRVAPNQHSNRSSNSKIMPWGRGSEGHDERQQEPSRNSSAHIEDDIGMEGMVLGSRSLAGIPAVPYAFQIRRFLIVDGSSGNRSLFSKLIRSLGPYYRSATIIEAEDLSGAHKAIAVSLQRHEMIGCIIIDFGGAPFGSNVPHNAAPVAPAGGAAAGGAARPVAAATPAAPAPTVNAPAAGTAIASTISAIRDRLGRTVKIVALFENERQLTRACNSLGDELVEALVKPLTRASLASKLGPARDIYAMTPLQGGESVGEAAVIQVRSSELVTANWTSMHIGARMN